MIIEYDKSPNIPPERRIQSLADSVQRAFEEISNEQEEKITKASEEKIDSKTVLFSEAKESAPIVSGSSLSTLFGQIQKNQRDAKHDTLSVGNIDMTITDEEYDELLNLLGGVLRLIDFIYPVGAVIASVNPDFDPNKIYRTHTWERFAKGQTLVGVDESDADFASAGLELGEKTHQLTSNELAIHSHTTPAPAAYYSVASGSNYGNAWLGGTPYTFFTSSVGGDQPHNNIQPSVTVYYWKRIS